MSLGISQQLGIKIDEDDDILRSCFFSFILPQSEYCSALSSSAADYHLRLLERAFNLVNSMLSDLHLDILEILGLFACYSK